jgi:hypothetical protein
VKNPENDPFGVDLKNRLKYFCFSTFNGKYIEDELDAIEFKEEYCRIDYHIGDSSGANCLPVRFVPPNCAVPN